jgi:hypothetical protein
MQHVTEGNSSKLGVLTKNFHILPAPRPFSASSVPDNLQLNHTPLTRTLPFARPSTDTRQKKKQWATYKLAPP